MEMMVCLVSLFHAHFNDVTLVGGADEIDFRHELGDQVPVPAQLAHGVDDGLFVDPAE